MIIVIVFINVFNIFIYLFVLKYEIKLIILNIFFLEYFYIVCLFVKVYSSRLLEYGICYWKCLKVVVIIKIFEEIRIFKWDIMINLWKLFVFC